MASRVNLNQIEKDYTALCLDAKDEKELQQCFDLFDEQRTNRVNPRDIKKALEQLGLDERNRHVKTMLSDLVRYCEERRVEVISFKEFAVIVTDKLGDTRTEKGLRKLFDIYDKNGDGLIDAEEIADIAGELCENLSMDDIKLMLHHVHVLNRTNDVSGFTFDEFKQILAAATEAK